MIKLIRNHWILSLFTFTALFFSFLFPDLEITISGGWAWISVLTCWFVGIMMIVTYIGGGTMSMTSNGLIPIIKQYRKNKQEQGILSIGIILPDEAERIRNDMQKELDKTDVQSMPGKAEEIDWKPFEALLEESKNHDVPIYWGYVEEMYRILREQNGRTTKENEQLRHRIRVVDLSNDTLGRYVREAREELEQVKKERNEIEKNFEVEARRLRHIIQSLRSELIAFKEEAAKKAIMDADMVSSFQNELAAKNKVIQMFIKAHKKRGAILTSACGDAEAIRAAYATINESEQLKEARA